MKKSYIDVAERERNKPVYRLFARSIIFATVIHEAMHHRIILIHDMHLALVAIGADGRK